MSTASRVPYPSPRRSRRSLTAVCALVLGAAAASPRPALAGIAPENVAVVVNADSPASKEIADEYARLREIPAGNIIPIKGLKDKERTDVETFRQQILKPVLDTLAKRGLTDQIDVIAYSSEIPTAIDFQGDFGPNRPPSFATPGAAINGLTFMHQLVLAKDVRYLDLNGNAYARRVANNNRDTPWTADEQRVYDTVLKQMTQAAAVVTQSRKSKDVAGNTDIAAATKPLQEAVDRLAALLKPHPRSANLHYNHACGLSLLGQQDAALAALKEAVRFGWADHRHTADDQDLRSLAGRDEFKALLKDMQMTTFSVQPSTGFRSTVGWLPDGTATTNAKAPRYLLSIVLACTTGRGMTVPEAMTQLRRAAGSDGTRPAGTIYFERNGDVRSTTREWAFADAARKLEALGVRAVVEDGVLPKNRDDVAGAVIGTAGANWQGSGSRILPGAIVEHFTSFGGAMRQQSSQTPLTEFLKAGAAGASGTVNEPYALQAKFPTAFMHVHYAAGCTLIESFYQSIAGPYQLLIVGDPLAQPWRRHFIVKADNLTASKPVSGELRLDARTESRDRIAADTYELYVDGRRIAVAKADQPLRWDSRQSDNGEHSVTLLARGNDPVQSVARLALRVSVRNQR